MIQRPKLTLQIKTALARSRAYGPMVRLLEAAPAATLGALPTPTAPARIEPHAQAQPAEVAADLAARAAAPVAAAPVAAAPVGAAGPVSYTHLTLPTSDLV